MIKSDIYNKSIRAIRFIFYKDISIQDQISITKILDEGFLSLFWQLKKEDRAHSLEVMKRVKKISKEKEMYKLALVHDIGKVCSDIGWFGRIFADIGFNRSITAKKYKDHETMGKFLLLRTKTVTNEDIKLYIDHLIIDRHQLLEWCDY
mgnify:CR=1 FL=1